MPSCALPVTQHAIPPTNGSCSMEHLLMSKTKANVMPHVAGEARSMKKTTTPALVD